MQRKNVSILRVRDPESSTQLQVSETVWGRDKAKNEGLEEPCVSWRLLAALVAFRVASAVLNQTSFVPDEYWQSLEVAHRITFGYGYQTWEWLESIRGYTHPLLYAVLYKMLALLHIDYGYMLVELPKVLNALLGVLCDVYVFKLAGFLHGPMAARLALLSNVSSWFLFYCLPRSMANSLETVLTAPLLYHWSRAISDNTTSSAGRRNTVLYLSLSAVAALVRPTAVVVSVPLVISHFFLKPNQWRMLLQKCIIVGVISLLWSLTVDWFFYQKVVFVQWNFFSFNVLKGGSAAFGSHPWHWYLSQGAPAVLGTSLPLLAVLLYVCWRDGGGGGGEVGMAVLGGWVVLVHSLLAHKEFRFIMQVIPIASVLTGHALKFLLSLKTCRMLGWCGCVLMLVNVPTALWFGLVHQRGTLDVMTFLRSNISDDSSILFLMPCHSTPLYSHIHKEIKMEFLECPPQLDATYIMSTDVMKEFYTNPQLWLEMRYPTTHKPHPTHIVIFDTLLSEIEHFLEQHRYQEATRLFHSYHPLESDMGTHIVVYVMQ